MIPQYLRKEKHPITKGVTHAVIVVALLLIYDWAYSLFIFLMVSMVAGLVADYAVNKATENNDGG